MAGVEDAAPTEAAARTTGASVLLGSAWNAASLILPQLYLVATSVMAARFLTPDEMGRQSYIALVSLAVAMVVTGGLPAALQRYVGETLGRGRPETVQPLLTWAWRVEAPLAALAAIALIAVAASGSEPQAAWVLAGFVAAFTVLQTIPTSALAGHQRWQGVSVLGIATGAASTVGTFVVLAAGGGITGMFAVELAAIIVNFAVAAWLARRALAGLRVRPVRSDPLIKATRRWALIASFSVLLTFIVWRRSEFLILNHYATDSAIAMYSIAFAAVTALTRLPEAIGMTVSPAFATLFGAGQTDRIRSGYARVVRLILAISLPLTALSVTVGPAAIRVVYGRPYEEAADLLVIMAASLPLLSLVSVSRGVIYGLGRQHVLVAVGIAGATANLTLAFTLIPAYAAMGAALANLGAQAVAATLYLAGARRAIGRVDWGARTLMLNTIASGTAGVLTLLVVQSLPPVAGVAAGLGTFGLAYTVLAVSIRVIPRAEADWLDSVLVSRVGGRLGAGLRRLLAAVSRG